MRLFACIAVLCASMLTAAPAARGDEQVGFIDVDENLERRARAADLLTHHRFAEALDVYRAAYAAHPSPSLLYLIGCTAQVAGRARLAEHYLRKYLELAIDAPPARRADATRRVDKLHRLIEEGTAQWRPENIEEERQRREGELAYESWRIAELVREMEADGERRGAVGDRVAAAGVAFTIISRVAAGGLFASALIARCPFGCGDLVGAAAVMQIGVVGPWIAAGMYDSPVMVGMGVTTGLLDGLGLTLILVGAARSHHDRVATETLSSLRLVPWTAAGTTGLTLAGTF